jgi:hypothetical protein
MSLACDLNINIAKRGILKGISNKYIPKEYENNRSDFKDDELQIPLKNKNKDEVAEIFKPILSTIEKDYKGNIKAEIVKNSILDPFYIKFNVNRDYILDQLQLTVKDINELQTKETIDTKIVDPLLNVQRGFTDPLIRQKYFSEGDTTTDKEILTKIANSSHPLNGLAKQLIKYVKGVPVRLVPEIISINPQTNKKENAAGLYKEIDLFTEEIQINEFIRFREMGVEPTIIHEILHSLSAKWLREVNEESELYKEFNKYYKETIQNVGEYIEGKTSEELGRNNFYAVKNLEEFIVALFTDAKFISVLKEIPASEPTKFNNKMEEIFNFLLSLFKINKNNSIYSEAFAVATNIIEDQKKLEDFLQGIDNFENLQDDIDNYYIDDYSEYTTELPEDTFQENIVTGSAKIFSTISELIPNISDEKINEIYNNYVNLISIARPGKEIPKEVFKNLITQYQVFNYKNTYIFGTYDPEKAVFVTRVNSSPSSKELLAEALPNLVNQGIDFISFVPEDVAKKYERSGYTISNNAFNYNFKGEDMLKYAAVSKPIISDKIFEKPLNEVTSKEFEEYNNSLFLGYIPVEVDGALIQKASTDLSNILEIYLNQFGIAVKDINEIKNKLKIDEVGFADILSKIAYVRDKKDLPPIAGEFIAYMMQYNPLVKSIINDLIQTEAFLLPKGFGTKDIKGNWVYNYNKLNKDEYFKYIGQLISEDLQNKLEGNYSKSLVDKIKDLIKQFFTYLTNTEINKINKNVGIISNNILQQNKRLVTSSIYKPGAYGKPTKQVSLKEAMASDNFGESIINVLSNIGFILTGSTSLGEQGTIQRPNENLLHDIDWVSPFSREETKNKFLTKYPEALKIRDIYGDGYITDTWLIVPEGFKISNLVIESDFNIITSYNVVDKNNNIVGTYNLKKQPNSNQKEEIVTGVQGKVIDFFTYESYNQKDPLIKNNVRLSNWKDIFKAKIEFARYKDIWDYNRFIPYENLPFLTIKPDLIPNSIEEQFKEANSLKNKIPDNNEDFNKKILYSLILPNTSYDRFLKIFSQNDPEEFTKYRQEKVKKIIDSFVKKFGITVETINQYQDRYAIANNKTISYNGVANLANKTIKYLEGDNVALTEEVAHFMIAMLDKNGPEYLALKNYISQTPEYQVYYNSYLEVYNNNVDKTEEEIMGKVLANALLGTKQEVALSLKDIIRKIFNKIKSFINPEFKQEFNNALNNITHLFFTENFDTAFNEANMTFDELYKLDFNSKTAKEDEEAFKKSSNQIINTLITNLKRQKTKFIQNKQLELVNKTNDLIKMLNSENSEITNADKIKDFIDLSVQQIANIQISLNEFEQSGVIKDLQDRDYSKLTREQQEAFTEEDRVYNLNYVSAAITTVQNLYSFMELINENLSIMDKDLASLKDFKKIVNSLPDSIENNIFKEIIDYTTFEKRQSKFVELKGIYTKISKPLLQIVFNTLSTNEQKAFLENIKKEPISNIEEPDDIKTEINILSTIKDYFKNKFSADTKQKAVNQKNDIYKSVKTNIMPISFQSDAYLVSIDNANAALRQLALMSTAAFRYEMDLLHTDLRVLGDYDQSFISAKDKNGKPNFKLLQKYNYLKFSSSLTKKIIKSHLVPLLSAKHNNITNGILKGNINDILKKLGEENNNIKQLKIAVSSLFKEGNISKDLYYFLLNFINGYELLYTLQLSSANTQLNNTDYQNLSQYQNEYIKQLENKLNNLNFSNKKLPYLNISFDFNLSNLQNNEIQDIVYNLVDIKRKKIIAKEVTIPENVNGMPNPIYYNKLGYAEGLLNFFKQKINYIESSDGDINLNLIDLLTLGDEMFFNLNENKSVPGIEFVDEDYIKLEKQVQNSTNSNQQKIAETKLKIIQKIQNFNNENNLKSNYLKEKLKYNTSQYLPNIPLINFISRIAVPVKLAATYSTNALYAPAIYYFSQFGINQMIKLFYFIKNNKNKSLAVFRKSAINEGYQINNIDLTPEETEEKSFIKALSSIFKGKQKKLEDKVNNIDDDGIIDTNNFLLGEAEIPKPFAKLKAEKSQLSTDFLSDFQTFVTEMSNYQTNVRWESWIRMAGNYQEIRKGSSTIIDLIKDRYFFNKFYNTGILTNSARTLSSVFAMKALTGNVKAQILNFLLGNINTLIHGGPIQLTKAWINVLQQSSNKLYTAIGGKALLDDFLTMLMGSNTKKDRYVFFTTLKNVFLGKNNTIIEERNNLTTHIRKHLASQRGTGIIQYQDVEDYFIRITEATNIQGLGTLVEKITTNLLMNSYFLSNPLVDVNNKPIKNLNNYLIIKDGKIVLDKEKLKNKLGIEQIYFKNDNRLKIKDYSNINLEDTRGFSEYSFANLDIQPLTDFELDTFLNLTMLENINILQERSQGVYNIFNKSNWRTKAGGILLLQFRDYILPSLTMIKNTKKLSKDFTSYEEGVIDSLDYVFNRLTPNDSINKFDKDSYQNALLVKNLDWQILFENISLTKFLIEKTIIKSNDDRLKELAKNNKEYRKLVNKPIAEDKLNELKTIASLIPYKNLSNDKLINLIKEKFKTNNENKVNIIKQLIEHKLNNKPLPSNLLNELNKAELQENYSEILQNYNKLQLELTGDVKAMDRLTNMMLIASGIILVNFLFKTLSSIGDDEKEELINKSNFYKYLYLFYDYAYLLTDNLLSNFTANYLPFIEPDAFGINIDKGTVDINKSLLSGGDVFKFLKSTYKNIFWSNDDVIRTSNQKIKDVKIIDKLTNNKRPFIKPIIKSKKLPSNKKITIYSLENNTEIQDYFLKIFISKDIADNFELYKNENDKEKYEKQKDLNFLELLILNAKNIKFAKFNGVYIDPDKQEKRDKELEEWNKERETLENQLEEAENNNIEE